MRKQLQLLSTTFLLFAAACDDAGQMLARSGMGSPMRYDTEPIKQKIKGNYFKVPANCYDSPIEVQGYDQGYAIDDGALFVTILPTLACRTRETKRRFQETGENRSRLMVLVSGSGQGVKPDDGFDRNFRYLSCQTKQSSCLTDSLKLVKETPVERFYQFRAASAQSDGAFDTVDVIHSNVRRSFTICTRFNRVKTSMQRPMVAGCKSLIRN